MSVISLMDSFRIFDADVQDKRTVRFDTFLYIYSIRRFDTAIILSQYYGCGISAAFT